MSDHPVPADPPSPLTAETIADAFHDALCPVSHHDRREVYGAAMGATQPCRVKYDRIAAALASSPAPAGLDAIGQAALDYRNLVFGGAPEIFQLEAWAALDNLLLDAGYPYPARAATRPAEDAGE